MEQVATTSLSKSACSETEIRNQIMKMDMCRMQVLFCLLWSLQTVAAGQYVWLPGATQSRARELLLC